MYIIWDHLEGQLSVGYYLDYYLLFSQITKEILEFAQDLILLPLQ